MTKEEAILARVMRRILTGEDIHGVMGTGYVSIGDTWITLDSSWSVSEDEAAALDRVSRSGSRTA